MEEADIYQSEMENAVQMLMYTMQNPISMQFFAFPSVRSQDDGNSPLFKGIDERMYPTQAMEDMTEREEIEECVFDDFFRILDEEQTSESPLNVALMHTPRSPFRSRSVTAYMESRRYIKQQLADAKQERIDHRPSAKRAREKEIKALQEERKAELEEQEKKHQQERERKRMAKEQRMAEIKKREMEEKNAPPREPNVFRIYKPEQPKPNPQKESKSEVRKPKKEHHQEGQPKENNTSHRRRRALNL